MGRIRSIKPELPQSESMGSVSRDARLTFILLWTLSDDEGRLRGNSRMLASLLFPYDNDAPNLIDAWMAELEKEGCIVRYKIEGQSYVQICNWLIHQKIDKPSKSKIPQFDESSRILANASHRIKDQGSKDQGEEGKGSSCAEPQSDSTPVVIQIPLIDKTEYPITEKQVDEWNAAYPAVDVLQQLREMRQWCLANPTKKKTSRGVMSFCNSWLMKEQDKPSQQPRGSPAGYESARDKSRRETIEALTGKQHHDNRTIDIN